MSENQRPTTPSKPRSTAKFRLNKEIILIIIMIILIIITCINISGKVNMQKKYTSCRAEMADVLYSNLYLLCQTFDQVNVPGASVESSVIPQMQEYFVTARTVNGILSDCYGTSYSVMDNVMISALTSAFDAYTTAFDSDTDTIAAQEAMTACVNDIRETLDERYTKGELQPAR